MAPAEDGALEPGWYRNPDLFEREHRKHVTFAALAAAHGGDATTYQKWYKRHGGQRQKPGPKPTGTRQGGDDEVDLTVERMDDIAAALRGRGLNPDEWVVIRCVVNAWDGFVSGEKGPETVPLRQLKVTLRPRLETLISPARDVTPLAKVRPASLAKARDKPRLVVFVGDEQAPYHDPDLHDLFCEWLHVNKPDEGVHLGDLMDFPTISRHRPNPLWNASVQQCVQAGYEILRAYRVSSPDTRWTALPGNHDERLRDYQLQRAPEMFGIRAADLDARELAAVHALPTLLHLDALRIEWRGSDADYEHAQVDIAPSLVARHGWITGANSAEKTVRRLGLNVVVGHTHRQRVHYVTEERRRETLVTVAVEAGCMCQVDGGLGYVINPDWQAGFAVANVFPDGSFHIDHAVYRDRVLTWRDQRYAARSTERRAA